VLIVLLTSITGLKHEHMNTRIRELLVEAREQTKEGKWNAPTAVWAEKFAELIVRECGILADQYNFEKNRRTINPFKTTAYEFIKQHFGVE